MADEKPKKDLIVVSCVELRKGGGGTTGKKEWVLYNVAVTDVNGIPIDREFRSWVKLEATGKKQTFEVEAGEYQGTAQYTLTPVRTQSLGERVEILERKRLEDRELLDRLTAMISQLQSGVSPEAGPADAGAPAGGPAPGGGGW